MLESKLEYTVNELLKNKDPKKNKMFLDVVGELLLQLPYFKMLMEEYPDPDLGPLMFINLVNHLIIQKFEPNSIIWEYNDDVTGVYIIITGEIKIFKHPHKSNLIRYKKTNKKNDLFINDNNITLSGKYTKATPKNIFNKNKQKIFKEERRSNFYRTSFFKMNTFKKKNNTKNKKSSSCINIKTNLELKLKNGKKDYKNGIFLTEKNFIYREPLECRELDYVETFGKMIGQDCLIQNLSYRTYGAETLTKSILGFLTSSDYHILFDKINSINRSNIISFLYNINYFNNKNNFVHKLYRGIKTILYSKGNYIYKQNEPFRSMFIIKKGNVNINLATITKVETDINSDLILGENNKKINHIKDLNEIDRFTSERFFELRGEYYEKKVYTIVNYGVGEILGNLEYFGKIKNYLCSAQCLNNVELYEIDIHLYKRIESPDNIEFLNKKTKKQLEFFKKRIREINFIHNKNNKDYYIGRNKFMKAFFHNNPASPLKEKSKKYINDSKNPIPIKIKIKNKKLNNTKISPFCSYEWASSGVFDNNFDINYNEKSTIMSPFITNNKEYTINFNDNKKCIINDRYNNNNNNNEINNNKEHNLLLLSSFNKNKNNLQIKFNQIKSTSLNQKKYRTLSLLNHGDKKTDKIMKPKKFDYSQIFAQIELRRFLSYYSFKSLSPKNHEQNKNNHNNVIDKYKVLYLKTPTKRALSSSTPLAISHASSPLNNNNTKFINKKLKKRFTVKEENKLDIKKEDKVKENIKKIENKFSDKIIHKHKHKMTTIDFSGYRVFLPKEEKGRNFKRYNSERMDEILSFGKKGNKKEFIKDKEDIINYKKKNIKRNTTINNNNLYKAIRIKSLSD